MSEWNKDNWEAPATFSSCFEEGVASPHTSMALGFPLEAEQVKYSTSKDGKKLSRQERNRMAQKRFRERKKAEMEEERRKFTFSNEELLRLKAEKVSLLKKHSVLVKILCLRDEQLRTLLNKQRMLGIGSDFEQHQELLPKECTESVDTKDERAIIEDSFGAKLVDTEAGLPHEEGIVAYWREFVGDLGNLLIEFDEEGDSNVKENILIKISEELAESERVLRQIALLNPTNFQLLVQATLDGGKSATTADDKGFWTLVIANMQLTENQRDQIIAMKNVFITRMKKIMAHRQGIFGKLRLFPPKDGLGAARSVIHETLRVKQATLELKDNMQDEHLCTVVFFGSIIETVLSPLQKARCIVQSYPFFPDVYQIASILDESQKERKYLPSP